MGAPIPSHSLVSGDKIDPVWFRYLQSLDGKANTSDIRAIATALGSPDGTVANIPEQSADDVRILQGAGIAVTRDDAGAYAIALRPLGDSGAGTFKLITRDSTGRISGSADGSAADVPYDNTASGLAAEDTQSAIDELAAEKLGDAPSDGSEYVRKDGGWAVSSGGGDAFNPATTAILASFNDFVGKAPVADTANDNSEYVAVLANSGTCSGIDGGNNAPGVVRLGTATSATAVASIAIGTVKNVSAGGGEITIRFRFRIPALSTVSERLYMQAGLQEDWSAGTNNNRIMAFYSHDVNGGALQLFCASGGATTTANSTTVLAANTWYRGKLVINAAGTSVGLYVNDVLEATVSSGLPTAAMRLGLLCGKSAGTATRNVDVDYFEAWQAMAIAR